MTAGRARALRPEFVKFLTYGNFSVETPSGIIWPIFSRKCADRCSVATPPYAVFLFELTHTFISARYTRSKKYLCLYFHTMRKHTHAHTYCMRAIPVYALKTPTRVLNAHAYTRYTYIEHTHTRNTNTIQAHTCVYTRAQRRTPNFLPELYTQSTCTNRALLRSNCAASHMELKCLSTVTGARLGFSAYKKQQRDARPHRLCVRRRLSSLFC